MYQDELVSLDALDGPGLVPARPDQKMVKKEDFEQSQKELQEQENKTANSLESKMNSELESVTKTGKIDQLDVPTQTKIRTEIIQASIDPQRLPDEKKKEILSTMKGADGQPIDMSKVKLDELTPSQKEFLLNSPSLKNTISQTIQDYKKIQEEAQKTGKKSDPELIKKLQSQLGLPNTDALDLSQIRAGMKSNEYPSDSHIGVVQRVLAESNFQELQETLGDGFRWSHISDSVKRELVADSFSYDPAKNNHFIEESISDAKATISNITSERKKGESNEQFTARIKEKIGVSNTNLEELSLEAKKS